MHCYGDSALRGGFKNMVIAGRSLELLCLDVFFVLAALSFIFCQISFGGFHFPLSSLFPSLSVLWICLSLKPQSVPFLCHFSLSSQPCTHPSSASRDFFLFSLPSHPFSLSARLRWESVFCYVGGWRSKWFNSAYVWPPETPEDRERLAAKWVGGKASRRHTCLN